MATTAERDVRNYQVDSATEEQFHNIATFAKNMVLKDSQLYENFENEMSKYFGDLFLKYIERELTEDDARKLITFVNGYNTVLDNMMAIDAIDNNFLSIINNIKITNTDDIRKKTECLINRLKAWGMFSGLEYDNISGSFFINSDTAQSFESSLLNVATSAAISMDKYNEDKDSKNLINFKNEISSFLLNEFFYKQNSENNDFLSLFIVNNDTIDLPPEYAFEKKEDGYYLSRNYLNINKNIKDLFVDVDNNIPIDNIPIIKIKYNDDIMYEYHLYKTKIQYKKNIEGEEKKIIINNVYNYIKAENIYILKDNEQIIFNEAPYRYKNSGFYASDNNPVNSVIFLDGTHIINNDFDKKYLYSGYDNIFYLVSPGFDYSEDYSELFLDKSNDDIYNFITVDKIYELNNNLDESDNIDFYYNNINNYEIFLNENESTNLNELETLDLNDLELLNDGSYKYSLSYDQFKYKYKDEISKRLNLQYDPDSENKEKNIEIRTTSETFLLRNFPEFYDNFIEIDGKASPFYIKLNSAAKSLILKEKIIILEDNLQTSRNIKLSASESEKSLLFQGSPLTFFDLSIPSLGVNGIKENISYFIQYKEFNKKYRALLDLDIIDSLLWSSQSESSESFNYNNIYKLRDNRLDAATIITGSMDYYFRNLQDNPILVRDFYFGMDTLQQTTKYFKYAYTNAYIARKACESEIIKYFIADPYMHEEYGKYMYEKEEIYKFLEIFSQTRDYYYKVLLNESFITDPQYKLYEKFFLITWSIERFLTSKIESLKDIDSFSMTDTKNFLTSYGLEDLAEIIDLQDFYNSEEMSKNIIKRYIDLVQNKGSRKIIDILEEVFKIPDGSLKIYKAYLIKDKDDLIGEIVRKDEKNYKWNGVYLQPILELNNGLEVTKDGEKYTYNSEEQKFVKDSDTTLSLELEKDETCIIYSDSEYIWNGEYFKNNDIEFPSDGMIIKYDDKNYIWDGSSSFINEEKGLSYSFINSDYDTENIIKELEENLKSSVSLESYTSNDKYWDASNTTAEYLNYFNIEIENTKYLIPEYVVEVSNSYYTTRYIFALIDFLEEFISRNGINSTDIFITTIQGSSVIDEEITLFKYISLIRLAFYTYLKKTAGTIESDTIFRINGINDYALNSEKYGKYFIIEGNSVKINKDEIRLDFGTKISTPETIDQQVELIYSILESLIPIYILSRNILPEGSKHRECILDYLDANNGELLDVSKISALFYNSMFLTRVIHDGYTLTGSTDIENIQLADLAFLDKKGAEFIYNLYEDVFITKRDQEITYLKNDSEYSTKELFTSTTDGNGNTIITDVLYETTFGPVAGNIPGNFFDIINDKTVFDSLTTISLPNKYIDKEEDLIISGCKELSDILGQILTISITESETQLIKFLKAVIEYFISYTSQIHDFKYIKSYNSKDENIQIFDRLEVMKETLDFDSFFYDESLNILLETKEE